MWKDEHEVKVKGVGRWKTLVRRLWWREGKKLFTHCSHSLALVLKMHGTSVRSTIICMAQRIEAMRATLLDTSTQDAPTVQHSLTQHSLLQKEDSRARRGLEKKDTQTQRKGMCVCVANNLCHCHLHPNHNNHINVEHRPHHCHTHSAAEHCDLKHPLAVWFTCRAHNFTANNSFTW